MMDLQCGDCLSVMRSMPADAVDLVLWDPPFNVGKTYGVDTNDAMSDLQYEDWYKQRLTELWRIHAGGYAYASLPVSALWTVKPWWEEQGYRFQQMVIWHGRNFGTGGATIRGPWRLLYEPILMFLKGPRLPMLRGRHGVKTDAVIDALRPQRDFGGELHRYHIAQKPVVLYSTLISRTPGTVVLDPFMGSGASGIAAVREARDYMGIEIDRAFFDKAAEKIGQEAQRIALPA